MTTSTFSFAEGAGLSRLLPLLCAATIGCGQADGATEAREVRPVARTQVPIPEVAAPTASARPSPPSRPADSRQVWAQDLEAAIRGDGNRDGAPAAAFGMRCDPERISSSAPNLTLALPEALEARRHVLAVVTPERGVLEIYSAYGDEAEEGDLILPSDVVTWARARQDHEFTLKAWELTGLRPDRDQPEAVFIEPGTYRVALVNSIDRRLLTVDRGAVRVFAACSFQWTPELASANGAALP